MTSLFDPAAIGNVSVRNRFVRSATWDASATDDGLVTDASVERYEALAQGGVGLIITGYAYISEAGRAAVGQYGVAEDRHIDSLRRLVTAAHAGGARIALQIAHSGLNVRLLGRDNPRVSLVPSKLEGEQPPHRAFTAAEIEETVADFAAAAVRARRAGFDAVQLHFAHGYLGSQFLSPLTNHRTDEWGGTPEKRRRFHLEVIRAVRQATGNDFPIWAKLGLQEAEGGLFLEEALDALKAMAEAGLMAVEVSAGQGAAGARTARLDDPENPYFRQESAAAKRAVRIPVILVGGVRNPATAQAIIDSGDADLISLCRPLIREPGIIARWQGGDPAPSKCISCNKCMAVAFRERVLVCQEEAALAQSG